MARTLYVTKQLIPMWKEGKDYVHICTMDRSTDREGNDAVHTLHLRVLVEGCYKREEGKGEGEGGREEGERYHNTLTQQTMSIVHLLR